MEVLFDHYRELEPLCGKDHVMLVQNTRDGQLYVKKRLRGASPELYRQLMAEPVEHTPTIHGVYEQEGQTVVIEEYLSGQTLSQYLNERGPVSEDGCIRIGLQLCSILTELHSRRPAIIHRDIKPSNVILQPDGILKLIDFSAAKHASDGAGRDTVLIGTAGFAAPEQYGFAVSTPQTDLYALGVLLNTMRTGSLPWEQRAGGRLKYVVGRCLKLDPRDRFGDARELRAALKRVQREVCPWLPPGFRSLRWYYMIPACLWYVFAALIMYTPFTNPDRPLVDQVNVLLTVVVFFLLPTAFYGDYLGFRRCFPLMRSRNRWVRLAGLVIAPVWMWLILCIAIWVAGALLG